MADLGINDAQTGCKHDQAYSEGKPCGICGKIPPKVDAGAAEWRGDQNKPKNA